MYALVTEVSREERCALFDTVHDPTSPRTYSPLRTNVSCQSQPSSVRVIPVPHSTESAERETQLTYRTVVTISFGEYLRYNIHTSEIRQACSAQRDRA